MAYSTLATADTEQTSFSKSSSVRNQIPIHVFQHDMRELQCEASQLKIPALDARPKVPADIHEAHSSR